MAFPLNIPRINNNDDAVRVAAVAVTEGAFVRAGETVLEIESEKAAVTVEAERDGYVLAVPATPGAMLPVGAVALWLGEQAGEAVPETAPAADDVREPSRDGTTAKARLLLARHGLEAAAVPRSGARLTAADVEAYVAARGLAPALPTSAAPALPAAATIAPAEPVRRGMVAAVAWQREHAVPAYLELPFDPAPWDAYAATFARANRSLFSPLLPLMAWRLVVLAGQMPAINATVLERPDGMFEARYATVNLGFTVQAGDTLYLTVLAGAQALDQAGCVARLGELQRRAIGRKLMPAELQGATIGFSSMARWGVARHVPVLAPHTAVMVAHSPGVLGITYDHRVLSGFDAARLLRALARPPSREESP